MRCLIGVIMFLTVAGAHAVETPHLFRQPALSATQLVFHYAGDLWITSRDGRDARRLTAAPGMEVAPFFSPDGQWIAFSGEYDGNTDVFVVPASGGVPRRLTWHPGADIVTGWSRDGKGVLFRSARYSYSRFNRLFTLATDAVFPEVLPFPMAEEGSYSPDGAQIAYVPLSRAFNTWKRYRGGQTTPIWIGRLSDSSVELIPRQNSNDFNPMWIDQRIFFLSDRSGPVTLFSYDTKTKAVKQEIANTGFDIKSAAAGPGAIAYEQFGGIYLYDLKSRKAKKLEIRLSGDMPEVRERFERVGNRVTSAAISPSGARAVFEARGDIFTVPAEKGDPHNITLTPGAAERDPAWSPDGRSIAYFSDASGEYELYVADQAGKAQVRKFRLSEPATYYYGPTWSPDSKKIAFTTKKLELAFLDLDSSKVTKVDTDRYDGPRRIRQIAWSPDGKWLVYTKQLRNTLRAAFVYSLESGKAHQITDGMSDVTSPVFDAEGKYIYLLASTDVGLNIGWRDMSSFFRPVTQSVYLVILRKDLPSPLEPESDEEKAPEATAAKEAAKPEPKGGDKPADKEGEKPAAKKFPEVKIDLEGIANRIVALPVPARNYTLLATQKAGILFLLDSPFRAGSADQSQPTLYKFELKTRKTDKVLDDVRLFDLAANGEKMLIRQASRWLIASTSQPVKAGEGVLKLDEMEVRVEPKTEWRQMFREAWRIQRDFFYDPNLHGLDLKQMMARYEPFLEGIESRADLNYLFMDMMGEFTASHLNVAGGSLPEVKRVGGGLLGADYTIENGRYRFARIYGGESWNPDLRAPLARPGVNAAEGEYLLAVNGRELRATDNLYSFFESTGGKQVAIKIGPNADGSGSRIVTVIPVESENRLRNLAWIEDNRRKVDQLSGGRLAYVYLPDTSIGGYTNFNRYYFAQMGKDGAVMDERFNSGGVQPDYIIDYLRRPLLHYRTAREGEDFTGPMGAIFGPKVMLINEYAGSGGDTMPWYFRRTGIGPLIGKRTWGGLVGGLGGSPSLIDGGFVSPPSVGFWDPEKREWVAENVGIKPDVEVEQDPKLVREGHDPQLEKAIEMMMDDLKKNPPPKHTRPPFPNYHLK